jgi:mRNA-degrading endonuclease toxin of MazEF toxin-antitoxin module
MKAWEIWTWDFEFGPHPVVIISHPWRVANKPVVNVLKCSSQRASRPPFATEIMLDQADGLNWETLCACDLIYAVPKIELRNPIGSVRRRKIVGTIVAGCGWTDTG